MQKRIFNSKNEPIVSFETAKMLKDAGFDWKTEGYYDMNKQHSFSGNVPRNHNQRYGDKSPVISAPTISQAHDWMCVLKPEELREFDMQRYYDGAEAEIARKARNRAIIVPQSLDTFTVGDRFKLSESAHIFMIPRNEKHAIKSTPHGVMEVKKVNAKSIVVSVAGEERNVPFTKNEKLRFIRVI